MSSKTAAQPTLPTWLDDAVFYEIYPQSFYDTNADGIGDLPGILAKLDYIQSLGVTAIWLNPCFASPFQDAGYDVADFYQIAPRYGTNDDFVRLCGEARKRGMRILLDLVAGHTSIQNPWFKESCKAEPNIYSDWFIWTHNPWSWEEAGFHVVHGYADRHGNYLTNFFHSQPALNYGFARPDPSKPWQQPVDAPGPQRVRQEIKNIMRYWLDLGASGFRVDMAGSLVKSDPGQVETARFWREIRTWLDSEYPEAVLVSEWSNPTVSVTQGGYHMDFMLHFGSNAYNALLRKPHTFDKYGFSFFDRGGRGNIREFLDDYLSHYTNVQGEGYIAIPTGNHDINPRVAVDRDAQDLELIYLFLMTMPGTPYIYYGDEIGMTSLPDIPSKEGGYQRTASRTPMQWTRGVNAGFSQAEKEKLYLPVDTRPDRVSVEAQEGDGHSLLNRVRRLVFLRRAHPALFAGSEFQPLYAEGGKLPFVYLRSRGAERILIAINPGEAPVSVEIDDLAVTTIEPLFGPSGALLPAGQKWRISLPGVSGIVYRI
jgi:maltose alpha-D-glucosyltransferase/alpha-amylase